MKRVLAVLMVVILVGYVLAQTPGTGRHSRVFLGLETDADVCLTYDLATTDETVCWDQSDSSVRISDDLRVTGPNFTIGETSSEDLIINFDDDAQTVWLRWDRSESRLAVSRDFYSANIIRSDQAFRSSQNATTDEVFQTTVSGDGTAWRRFNIWADGRIIWTNGTDDPATVKTNLYRISTGVGIRTDDDFSARGDEISVGQNNAENLCFRFDADDAAVDDPTICWNESQTEIELSNDTDVQGDLNVTGDLNAIQGSDIWLGNNDAVDKTIHFDGSTNDGTILYDVSAGEFVITPGQVSTIFQSGTPQIEFLDTSSGDAVPAGSFIAPYDSDAGAGSDAGEFQIYARFDGSLQFIQGFSWNEVAAGVEKPLIEYGSLTSPKMTETYTGTTANSGHWKYDTLGGRFEWTKDHYISEAGGSLIMKDSGGTCYDCKIDTTALTTNSDKSWAFKSPQPPGTGTFYVGGYYDFASADANLTQASTTQTYGTSNVSYAAHAVVIAGGAGSTDGSDLVLTVTGVSINDNGTRNGADSEVVVADCTAASANEYFETSKKWLGTITYTLSSTGGTAFSFDFNYGFSKYWDNNNTDYTVIGLETTWLGGATDSDPDLALIHHKATGWTYNASAEPTVPTAIARMSTDHSTDDEVRDGEQGAWKRSNLNQAIDGDGSEGVLFEVTTSAAKAFELGTAMVTIQATADNQSNWTCTSISCP